MARKRQPSTVPTPQKKTCGNLEKVPGTAATLEQQLMTITRAFDGIEAAQTLSIKDGASIALFSQKELTARVAEGRVYKCCCSLFICNLYHNPNPEVPIVGRQVKELIEFHFPTAPDLDQLPEIWVNAPGKKFDLEPVWGTLSQVSPYEMTLAILGACYRDLTTSRDQALHNRWRKVLLAVPIHFKHFEDPEAAFMHGVYLRQKAIQQGVSLQRTPMQWAIEIMAFRELAATAGGKPLGAAALAQKFIDANFEFAATAEAPTKKYS